MMLPARTVRLQPLESEIAMESVEQLAYRLAIVEDKLKRFEEIDARPIETATANQFDIMSDLRSIEDALTAISKIATHQNDMLRAIKTAEAAQEKIAQSAGDSFQILSQLIEAAHVGQIAMRAVVVAIVDEIATDPFTRDRLTSKANAALHSLIANPRIASSPHALARVKSAVSELTTLIPSKRKRDG